MIKNGELFKRCLLACETAAVSAGFVPETGRDLYLGQITKNIQSWSEEQYGKWVVFMVELHGEKSSDGIELAILFEEVCHIMIGYGTIYQ